MDTVGTVSMIFEISSLLGSGGKMQTTSGGVDAMLIRTARAAKVREPHVLRASMGQGG